VARRLAAEESAFVSESRPDFIIIGAMKSATSMLHEQLALQGGFFMSTPKEPNFFSDNDCFTHGLDSYRGLFSGAPEGSLRGESSTHYTKLPEHPGTVERLLATGWDCRFIYVMRHPIDRMISHYIHEWTQRMMHRDINDELPLHPELIDYGRYAYQLRPWLKAVGTERVLPVFFEALQARPQTELDRIGAFLGASCPLTWQEVPPQNVSAERMRKSVLRDAILNNPVLAAVRRTLVPAGIRERVKGFWMMRQRPSLSEANLAWVTSRFDEDLAELGGFMGVPLDCGNFKAKVTQGSPGWLR
jgi:Sulfotransferase family